MLRSCVRRVPVSLSSPSLSLSLSLSRSFATATLYTAHTVTTGGRAGSSKSSDGNLSVKLTVPSSMGGDGAAGTNPEQLFAAGYSACFLGQSHALFLFLSLFLSLPPCLSFSLYLSVSLSLPLFLSFALYFCSSSSSFFLSLLSLALPLIVHLFSSSAMCP